MNAQRFQVLDSWRGISILLVLAAHLMPIGPKELKLNHSAGMLGMAFFFTLSGFLITHFLLNHSSVLDFLIRRFFRIIPLAWLYMALVLYLNQSPIDTWLAHMLFYANYPPKPLIIVTDHMWSLCVEMQFYIGIALMVALLRKRGLYLLPSLCVAITLCRVSNEVYFSVITHYRVDEILVGCSLALIYNNKLGSYGSLFVARVSCPLLLVLLLISCHPNSGFMNYFRPYLAALLVGNTLFNQQSRLVRLLNNRILFYIASISYALYVIHPLLSNTWLGSGDIIEKYTKRPLLFASMFVLGHLSTYYFERRWITLGKQLSEKMCRK